MATGDFIVDRPSLATPETDAVLEIQRVSKPTETEKITLSALLAQVTRIDDNVVGGAYGDLSVDGGGTVWTVSAGSYVEGSLIWSWNGQDQPGDSFTENGAAGTFTTSFAPSGLVMARYRTV